MEKLTWKDKYGGVYMDGENVSLQDYDTATVCTGRAVDKLSQYEDTGLTPEEIMDGKLLTGWISVEEKLPEHNTYVICTNEETVRELFYSCGCFYSGMDDQTREVTHWMPLPQPLIAHARVDIPALVAEVERQSKEISTLKRALELACKYTEKCCEDDIDWSAKEMQEHFIEQAQEEL